MESKAIITVLERDRVEREFTQSASAKNEQFRLDLNQLNSDEQLLQTHQNLSNLVQPQHSDTDSLTVSQLKELLKSRQLPTTGKRTDLLTRWTNFTQTHE